MSKLLEKAPTIKAEYLRVLKADFDKLAQELEQIRLSAFWLETYAVGLSERARRLGDFVKALQELSPVKNETLAPKQPPQPV